MTPSILPLPAFQDNYIWIINDDVSSRCIIVDPGDAQPVIDYLEQHQRTPEAILITHHHHDHTGGVHALCQRYDLTVYGPAAEDSQQTLLKHGDTVSCFDGRWSFEVMATPGHTLDHISYYGHGCLFCGDTLFLAGCGRLFEGTAEQMLHSLSQLTQLPDDTLVYCAHEYTLNNLAFAAHIDQHNDFIHTRIKSCEQQRAQNQPTIPATLAQEKQSNPFLRCHLPQTQQAVSQQTDIRLNSTLETFRALRQLKDDF